MRSEMLPNCYFNFIAHAAIHFGEKCGFELVGVGAFNAEKTAAGFARMLHSVNELAIETFWQGEVPDGVCVEFAPSEMWEPVDLTLENLKGAILAYELTVKNIVPHYELLEVGRLLAHMLRKLAGVKTKPLDIIALCEEREAKLSSLGGKLLNLACVAFQHTVTDGEDPKNGVGFEFLRKWADEQGVTFTRPKERIQPLNLGAKVIYSAEELLRFVEKQSWPDAAHSSMWEGRRIEVAEALNKYRNLILGDWICFSDEPQRDGGVELYHELLR